MYTRTRFRYKAILPTNLYPRHEGTPSIACFYHKRDISTLYEGRLTTAMLWLSSEENSYFVIYIYIY